MNCLQRTKFIILLIILTVNTNNIYAKRGYDCNINKNDWHLHLGYGLATGYSKDNKPDLRYNQNTCSSLIMNEPHDLRVVNWEPSYSIMNQLPQAFNDGYIKIGYSMNQYYTKWFHTEYYGSPSIQSLGLLKDGIKPCQLAHINPTGCSNSHHAQDNLTIHECVNTFWMPRVAAAWNTWLHHDGGKKVPWRDSGDPNVKIPHITVAAVYANCAIYDKDLKSSAKIIDVEQNWWSNNDHYHKIWENKCACKNRIKNDAGEVIAGVYGTFKYFEGTSSTSGHLEVQCDDYPSLFDNRNHVTQDMCDNQLYDLDSEESIFDCWIEKVFTPWANGDVKSTDKLHTDYRMCRQDVYPKDKGVIKDNKVKFSRPFHLPPKTAILQEFVARMKKLPKKEKRLDRLKVELDYIFRYPCVCMLSRSQPTHRNHIWHYYPMLLTGERCVLMPLASSNRTIKFPEFWESQAIEKVYLSVPSKVQSFDINNHQLVLNYFTTTSALNSKEYGALRDNATHTNVKGYDIDRSTENIIDLYEKQDIQKTTNDENSLFDNYLLLNYTYRAPKITATNDSNDINDNNQITFTVEGQEESQSLELDKIAKNELYNLRSFKANMDPNTKGLKLKVQCEGYLVPDEESISLCQEDLDECLVNPSLFDFTSTQECQDAYDKCVESSKILETCIDKQEKCKENNEEAVCAQQFIECQDIDFIDNDEKFGYYCRNDNFYGQVSYNIDPLESSNTNYSYICMLGWTPYLKLSETDDIPPILSDLNIPLSTDTMSLFGFTSYHKMKDSNNSSKIILKENIGFQSRDYGLIDVGTDSAGKEVDIYHTFTNIPIDNNNNDPEENSNITEMMNFYYDNTKNAFRKLSFTGSSKTYKRYIQRQNFIDLNSLYTDEQIINLMEKGYLPNVITTDSIEEVQNMIANFDNIKPPNSIYYIYNTAFLDFRDIAKVIPIMDTKDANIAPILQSIIPLADPLKMQFCKKVKNYTDSETLLNEGVVKIKIMPDFPSYNKITNTKINYEYSIEDIITNSADNSPHEVDFTLTIQDEFYPNLKIDITGKKYQLCGLNGINYIGTNTTIEYNNKSGEKVQNIFCMPTHFYSGFSGSHEGSTLGNALKDDATGQYEQIKLQQMSSNYIDPTLYNHASGNKTDPNLDQFWPSENITTMNIVPNSEISPSLEDITSAQSLYKLDKVKMSYLINYSKADKKFNFRKSKKVYCKKPGAKSETKILATKNKLGYYTCTDGEILINDVSDYLLPIDQYTNNTNYNENTAFEAEDGFLACNEKATSIQTLQSTGSLKKTNCPLSSNKDMKAIIDVDKLNGGASRTINYDHENIEINYVNTPDITKCMTDYQDQYASFEIGFVPYSLRTTDTLEMNYTKADNIKLLTMDTRDKIEEEKEKLNKIYYNHKGNLIGRSKDGKTNIYYQLEPIKYYLNINSPGFSYLKNTTTQNILSNVTQEQAEKYGAKDINDSGSNYDLLETVFVGYDTSLVADNNYTKTTKHYMAYNSNDTNKHTALSLPSSSCILKSGSINTTAKPLEISTKPVHGSNLGGGDLIDKDKIKLRCYIPHNMIYEAYKDKSTVSCIMDDWLGNRLDDHAFNLEVTNAYNGNYQEIKQLTGYKNFPNLNLKLDTAHFSLCGTDGITYIGLLVNVRDASQNNDIIHKFCVPTHMDTGISFAVPGKNRGYAIGKNAGGHWIIPKYVAFNEPTLHNNIKNNNKYASPIWQEKNVAFIEFSDPSKGIYHNSEKGALRHLYLVANSNESIYPAGNSSDTSMNILKAKCIPQGSDVTDPNVKKYEPNFIIGTKLGNPSKYVCNGIDPMILDVENIERYGISGTDLEYNAGYARAPWSHTTDNSKKGFPYDHIIAQETMVITSNLGSATQHYIDVTKPSDGKNKIKLPSISCEVQEQSFHTDLNIDPKNDGKRIPNFIPHSAFKDWSRQSNFIEPSGNTLSNYNRTIFLVPYSRHKPLSCMQNYVGVIGGTNAGIVTLGPVTHGKEYNHNHVYTDSGVKYQESQNIIKKFYYDFKGNMLVDDGEEHGGDTFWRFKGAIKDSSHKQSNNISIIPSDAIITPETGAAFMDKNDFTFNHSYCKRYYNETPVLCNQYKTNTDDTLFTTGRLLSWGRTSLPDYVYLSDSYPGYISTEVYDEMKETIIFNGVRFQLPLK